MRSGLPNLPTVPTAHNVLLGVTVMAASRLFELVAFGLDTMLKLAPSPCSVRVC